MLRLEHFAEGLAQFARQYHVAHFDGVDLHADGLRLRRDEFTELRADSDVLREQRFHRDAREDGADGRLVRAVDVRRVVVYGLHALGGIGNLRGEHDAELHTDVIGARHFLAGDLKERLAHIDERDAEVVYPSGRGGGPRRVFR